MLKDERKKKGLTQDELSKLSGVAYRMVQYYEQGNKNIDGAKLSTLLDLSNALDCGVSDILSDDELIKKLKDKTDKSERKVLKNNLEHLLVQLNEIRDLINNFEVSNAKDKLNELIDEVTKRTEN